MYRFPSLDKLQTALLKSDGKKLPSCFESISLKLRLHLKLIGICCAIHLMPHKLRILHKIIIKVQLLLSAIYRLFLPMGLHHFVGGSTGPGYSLLRIVIRKKISQPIQTI